jgi:hypothetical protein
MHRVTYSTFDRAPNGPAPDNTQIFHHDSLQGRFRVEWLPQSHVLHVLQQDPVERGHLYGPFDVSLRRTLMPIWSSVGIVHGREGQIGSCTLISANLALIPAHCIEEIDISSLVATFGYVDCDQQTFVGTSYRIQGVVEFDQEVDYAIVKIEGTPGLKHSFIPLHPEVRAYAKPALLHHPLNKPLQLSINTFVQTNYQHNQLSTYHDSDYGSSGGAYISPSGFLIALHLGSSCDQNSLNRVRLALPIDEILRTTPNSLLAQLAYRMLDPKFEYDFARIITYLPYYLRPLVDIEAYDPKRLDTSRNYILRDPTPQKPGVLIEAYQKKHSPWWPVNIGFDKGVKLNLNADDTILLAQTFVDDYEEEDPVRPGKRRKMFDQFHAMNWQPKLIRWPLDKGTLGKRLYKQLNEDGVQAINVYAAYDTTAQRWDIHFYPQK